MSTTSRHWSIDAHDAKLHRGVPNLSTNATVVLLLLRQVRKIDLGACAVLIVFQGTRLDPSNKHPERLA